MSLNAVRERIVPAVLTAAGVTLLAAGLLDYGSAVFANPEGSSGVTPSATPAPSNEPIGYVPPSLPPINASGAPPSPSAKPDPNRVATRVVIRSLGIDLPVITQPNPDYPSCNVAMYYEDPRLGQPGSGRPIYLYAHARVGMFYPLYERAILGRHGGAKSLDGLLVDVYTSDDRIYEYSIYQIRPRVPADSHFLDGPFNVKKETLWLQTSTGPDASYPKLQVLADLLFVGPANHRDAHPKAHPVNCA
jgi:sortase (surface protein transpeptidase)